MFLEEHKLLRYLTRGGVSGEHMKVEYCAEELLWNIGHFGLEAILDHVSSEKVQRRKTVSTFKC